MASTSASAVRGPPRPLVLRLYRRLLQQGHRFADYNFRETAKRKIQQQANAQHTHTHREPRSARTEAVCSPVLRWVVLVVVLGVVLWCCGGVWVCVMVRCVLLQFRAHRGVSDVSSVSVLYKRGEEELSVLQRQVLVHNLYHHQPYVIEQMQLQQRQPQQQQPAQHKGEQLSPGAVEGDQQLMDEQLTSFTHSTTDAAPPRR